MLTRIVVSVLCVSAAVSAASGGEGQALLDQLGVKRGICVVLGDATSTLAVDLARHSELVIYQQFEKPEEAEAATKAAEAARLYGTRIFIERAALSQLALADNLADAVVVRAGAAVPEAEVLRVLNPLGRALLGDQVLTKPFPEGADDWSHPFHGPDNNPQSKDKLTRYPYRTQFLAEPKFSPMPEVTVAAGGRIFRAHGNLAHRANQNAVLNTLMAINGYNGTILWKRPLREGFLIHRNTMVATPEVLYLADDESCKLLDARTGELKDQIVVPAGLSDGPVWKWMALDGGVLLALVGGEEVKAPTRPSGGTGIGHWPWGMWPGYEYKDPKRNTAFGRTFVAFDAKTKKLLWSHREDDYIDGRSVCMGQGRIYFYCPDKFLACLDAKTGAVAWKQSDAELLAAIGPSAPAQHFTNGYSTTAYVKCNGRYVFLAGPQRPSLVAVSAADGKLAWKRNDGNFQLVLRDDAIYAVGSQGKDSYRLAYDTGQELARFLGRRACTRATGSIDSIFYRAAEGTVRIELTGAVPQATHLSPMRPPCQDGVVIAGGMLYWGPWMCGCPLAIYGHVGLAPAGELNAPAASDGSRLEKGSGDAATVKALEAKPGDWPEYCGNSQRECAVTTKIPARVKPLWTYEPQAAVRATAPVTAGGLVFTGNDAGVVSALDAKDGKLLWKAYTGGQVAFPPAIWNGRAYAGSGDGWVYAWEAATGRRLWRFRAAPAARRIPVFGRLSSTWPVAGGVVVRDGVVYAAAGIADYDGTYVYALDAVSGQPSWVNDTSGRLSAKSRSGISLQGSLALSADGSRLCFAGGNVYGQAEYDLKTGQCLIAGFDAVAAKTGVAFYAYLPEYGTYAGVSVKYPDGKRLSYSASYDGTRFNGPALLSADGGGKPKPIWEKTWECLGVVVGADGLVAARETTPRGAAQRTFALTAVKLEDGATLWEQTLPGIPVKNAVALDGAGRWFVSLADGRIAGFAAE